MGNSTGAASFIDSIIGSLNASSVNPFVTLNNSAITAKSPSTRNFKVRCQLPAPEQRPRLATYPCKEDFRRASIKAPSPRCPGRQYGALGGSFTSSYNCPAIATVGNILMTSNFVSQLSTSTGNFQAGKITLKANVQAILNTNSPTFTAGDVSLSGSLASIFSSSGIATVDKFSTSPGQIVQFSAGGTSLTVNGDLNVRASKTLSAGFAHRL